MGSHPITFLRHVAIGPAAPVALDHRSCISMTQFTASTTASEILSRTYRRRQPNPPIVWIWPFTLFFWRDQEPVRGGRRNNQDEIINGAQLFLRLLPGAVTVHLLPKKRRFAFPVAPSELGFVFSLQRLQVQNFLVETVPLFLSPSLAQLDFEVK